MSVKVSSRFAFCHKIIPLEIITIITVLERVCVPFETHFILMVLIESDKNTQELYLCTCYMLRVRYVFVSTEHLSIYLK